MKRLLTFILVILITLTGCSPKVNEPEEQPSIQPLSYLDIYYLNDFHGAIEKDSPNLGIAYLANYIEQKRLDNPNGTLLLAGGDMLQGSALSNYYQGQSTLTIMDQMKFDAMVVGNHEFDWGIEVVTQNFLGDQALSFPLLGANIFHKETNELVDGIDPYTIITRGDVKIGVIGIMGDGLESSIATSKVSGYSFERSLEMVKFYASYLREDENVDYVIVLMHDPGGINSQIDALSGSENVDIIFNAHDHQKNISRLPNGTLTIKSGSNGQAIGHVRIDLETSQMTGVNVSSDTLFNTPNAEVQTLIDQYKLGTDEIFLTPIIDAGQYMSKDELTEWVANLMRVRANADIAFHNTGGTRASINHGEVINYAKIYEILPFDNVIKSAYILGSEVKKMMADQGLRYSTLKSSFDDQTYYLVATNDYIYDQTSRPFITAEQQFYNGDIVRDLMRDELLLQKDLFDAFYISNQFQIQPDLSAYTQDQP
ncbi:MAG: 5'-nucleotidase C-terminal domain-containing protein [Acholeplasmataceae bacterium]|nr:5'-nucleotidase C-terminal domain-containing protein [Acholeplasmataceae bacterium]